MDCVESTIQLQSMGLQKIVQALPRFRVGCALSPDCDCERMLILGQLGMFSCNLWISQDFGAILLIPWQSFAVSQSRHNSIGLSRLRSRLLSRCFGRNPMPENRVQRNPQPVAKAFAGIAGVLN